MSIERASVNCERCQSLAYEHCDNLYQVASAEEMKRLAKTHGVDERFLSISHPSAFKEAMQVCDGINYPELRVEDNLANDQVYTARNEAMKSLENVDDPRAKMALEACRTCTYDVPHIAGILFPEKK